MAAELAPLVSRLEKVADRLENVANSGSVGGAHSAGVEAKEYLDAYDTFLAGKFKQWTDLGKKIGGDVREQTGLVEKAFQAQRAFLSVSATCKKPSTKAEENLLVPTVEALKAVQDYREGHRASKLFNHLSALHEAIPMLAWVKVTKPAPYVKEMSDAAQFYINRVLKDYKDTDKTHVEWARAFKDVATDFHLYVKDFHVAGLYWNTEGGDAPTSAGVAGPPPPPPPAVVPPSDAPAESTDKVDKSGLFAELNKGSAITSGLKKVTKDQMTHKNPALRGSSVVKAADKPTVTTASTDKKPAAQVQAQPVLKLQGKKWIVEHQVGNKEIVISDTNMKQSVYMYKCVNSTVQVKGKINNVTVDNCKKTAVVVDECIAGLDIGNSQSIQAQVMGKLSLVSIDKTDGCQVYLSKDSVNAVIVSAKSSEMNIMVPQGDGDFAEVALPEQFRSKWNGKTMVTEPSEIAG
ncbi:adenylyl cyclase-associated protein 1-like [Corticium candelabrum]|uniref:adenylyl cyclase-associated protein 1-like n=1 Tax=Corticium candelabrum TaxID=121492 RepID=UPI002E256D11|nr:adenylyl cyclase-associated protein 1-like [Corticium candelabrum]